MENTQTPSQDLKHQIQDLLLEICASEPLKFSLRNRQIQALLEFIRKERDIFVVLPTGYGKTIIGILAAMYIWQTQQKRTIYIGIYKALTQEIHETLSTHGLVGFIDDGDHRNVSGEYETMQWQYCCLTPEKFDAILCNPEKRPILMDNIGLVITDEVQNIGEIGRGDKMENYLMILKMLYPEVRHVFLSATVGNPETIASWLDCALIQATQQERPVPLEIDMFNYEEIMYEWNDEIPDQKTNFELKFEHLCELVAQYPEENFLVFCTSRMRIVQVAKRLANSYSNLSLDDLIEKHIAYHSAELTKEERDKVETAYRNNEIRILCATPTLAAGVNLPADHVVIFDVEEYDTLKGSHIIPINRMQQEMGRAGRPGLSIRGYAHIFTPTRLSEQIQSNAIHPSNILSVLKPRIHEKILKWICGRVVEDTEDVACMCEYALDPITNEEVTHAIQWLEVFGFISDFHETVIGKMTNLMYVMPESVVDWQVQIASVHDPKNVKELFIRFASTPEYFEMVIVRKEDAKLFEYAQKEIGRFFPGVKELPNQICFTCKKRNEVCLLKQPLLESCSEYTPNIPTLIEYQVLKAFFLTFYEDLAPKYFPKKWNPEMKKEEIKDLPISFGDKKILQENGCRMFTAAGSIFYQEKEIAHTLRIIASMIEAGTLNQEIVELCQLQQIGIKRANALFEYGVKTSGEFLALDPEDLGEIIGVSPRIAKKIQDLNSE